MNYKIENEILEVTINTLGAELQNVRNKKSGIEYMWQGEESIWKDRGPNLFPVIGRLKEGKYSLDGKDYFIDRHGFAKHTEFNVVSQADNEIVFSIMNNEKTLKVYPFEFEFRVVYTLDENKLIKKYEVVNLSENVMFYEAGGHDGFSLELTQDYKFEDYFLEFKGNETLSQITLDENVLLNKEEAVFKLENGRINLNMDLFIIDTLIFKNIKNSWVKLGSNKHNYSVELNFEGFPYLAVWTKYLPGNNAKYLCIEPWTSLPDCNYLGFELDKKEGIKAVLPGSRDIAEYTVAFN